MIIPKLHYVSQGNTPEEHLENIQKACTSGIELVRLNLNGYSDKEVRKTAEEVHKLTAHYQTRLILNDNYKLARDLKADGVHISDPNTDFIKVRNHLYTWQMLGGTAFNLEQCETLLTKEVDYINLGSFKAEVNTVQHALGLNGYMLITEALKTETPILGFGGITTADVTQLLTTGISGISISDAITSDFNSIRTFNKLLNASVTEEQRHTF